MTSQHQLSIQSRFVTRRRYIHLGPVVSYNLYPIPRANCQVLEKVFAEVTLR